MIGRRSSPSRGVSAQRRNSPSPGDTSNCSISANLRKAFAQQFRGRGDFGDDLAAAGHAVLQIFRRVRGEDFAVEHDEHPAAHHFRLRQDVRRNQHRVRAREAFDQLPHRPDLARVEADGRFVQNDQFRLMHQRVRQTDALPVAFRKLADDAAAHVRQAALLHHRRDALAGTPPAEALEPRAEFQVFPHAHFGVQRVVLRHVADAAAHLRRLMKHVEARHARRAARRRQEAGQNAHRRAFARAVRAEQADDFAARDRERDVRHRRAARVAFGQIGNFNHQILQP